ncbi:MFS transporter [Streptomyces sp. 8L]|uniref:MFS transporter n=1 Tax=Streptomyces sp. 8L TaxID=2877242 RepID=UPI001CD2BDAD|nr:MFS transporter [Streptomyces sp. 8L]MCA1222137.1 MFS transporter [Streptomyces sp. 8L]
MFSRVWLLLLAVGTFAIGTDGYVITGLLPEIGHDLGVSDGDAGQLITVFALTYAIGAPLLAVAIGSWQRKPVLVTSLSVFSLSNACMILVHSYPEMMALRVLAALSAAAFTPAAAAAVPALVPSDQRGRALGTVSAGIAMSTAIGVPLGTLVGGAFGWRTTFLAIAVFTALSAAGLAIWLSPLGAAATAGVRARVAAGRAPGVPSALLVTMLWIAGAFTLLTYLSSVLATLGGIHGGALSIWLAVYGVAAVSGNALGGRAADRLPTSRLTVVSTGGLTIALASFGLLGSLGARGATGAGWALVGLVVWGIFGWSFAPIQQHRLVELAPDSAGVVLSLNGSAIYLGISLGGFLGSIAIGRGGATAVGWTATAIEVCATAAALTLALRAGARTRQEPAMPAPMPDVHDDEETSTLKP